MAWGVLLSGACAGLAGTVAVAGLHAARCSYSNYPAPVSIACDRFFVVRQLLG